MQTVGRKIQHDKRMPIHDHFGGEVRVVRTVFFFQGRHGLFQAGTIQAGPTAAGHDVNHALRFRVLHTIEGGVQRELAVYLALFIALRFGDKLQRHTPLIIVDVAGESEIHAAFLKERLQRPNLLLGIMTGRALETRNVEANQFPGRLRWLADLRGAT